MTQMFFYRSDAIQNPTRPNEAWVTNITYIQTGEGGLYLARLKDVFTCEIVGDE